MPASKITVTLDRDHAKRLREWLGARPASEDWSRTVYILLGNALDPCGDGCDVQHLPMAEHPMSHPAEARPLPDRAERHVAAYSNKFSRSEIRASCSCGWVGVDQADGDAAQADFESHVAFEEQCATCRADVERARVLFKDAGFPDEKAAAESAKVRCWEHANV